MEGLSRGSHATNASGQVPMGSSTPSNYNSTLPIMPSSFQSPMSMPNFKIRIASPIRGSDGGLDLVSPVERPQKRRKLEEDPSKVLPKPGDDDLTPPSSQKSLNSSNSKQQDDGFALPYPAHRPRRPAVNHSPSEKPPRQSLTNESIKYGISEPPQQAVRYCEGRADYFPWEGNHVEDLLTEKGTQTGHFEKMSSLLIELGSSRPSVLSALKNKAGIENMSSLMASTLARRVDIAAVISRNTFKPPPRVTLTDTRREAWLKELASNDVPLRRLSKTIPHGIRGRPLLEQCLAKSVPVWRAIWLIKCIGSNEIRAFRRKGAGSQAFCTSGESKWMKEWTESVVETISAIIHSRRSRDGHDVWQQRLLYMLTLTQRIYEERLLDKGLFYEGMIQGFQNAKENNDAATWMASLAPYAKDVSTFCHRGQQFLKALLDKISDLDSGGRDAQIAVFSDRCMLFATGILEARPQCGILPEKWQAYEKCLLKDENVRRSGLAGHFIQRLRKQNAILDRETQRVVGLSFPQPTSEVVALCDQNPSTFDPMKLLESCQRLISEPATLAHVLIKWALDPCRPGLRPIFAAVRLLRLMHKSGYDSQELVLAILDTASTLPVESSRRLYCMVVELVRSKHFSVSKYLQRRMVRGVSAIKKEHLEVLAHLPPQTISPEVLNLASSLCEHAGYKCVATPAAIQSTCSKLDGMFLKSGFGSGFAVDMHTFISSLQPNMKHALALHMRKEIVSKRDQQAYPSPDDHRMDVDSGFYAPIASIVTVLELVEDYPIFADILILMIPSCSSDSLRLVTRCTMCHRDVFQTIGALEHLYKGIMKRYATLYQQESRQKGTILSLIDMMGTVSGSERTVAILKEHLSSVIAEDAGIAPSPVSDQMLDVLQSYDVRSLGDLENILNSGNLLDEGILQRMLRFLFRALMSNTGEPEQMVHALNVLACLKIRNQEAFRKLACQWLDQVFSSDDLRIAIQVVPWALSGGVITIADIVSRCAEKAATNEKKAWATSIAANVFVAALKPPRTEFLNSMEHFYRLKQAQSEFVSGQPALLATLIGLVLDATMSNNESAAKRAKQLGSSSFFESIFMASLCNTATAQGKLATELRRLAPKGVPVGRLLAGMLKCDDNSVEDGDPQVQPKLKVLAKVARKVDETNTAPCQLLTQLHIAEIQKEAPTERVKLFRNAAKIISGSDSNWRHLWSSWSSLIIGAPHEFIYELHSRALMEALDVPNNPLRLIRAKISEEEIRRTNEALQMLDASESYLSHQQSIEAFDRILEAYQHWEDGNANARRDSVFATSCSATFARLAGIHLRSPHEAGFSQDKLLSLCIMLGKAWNHCHSQEDATVSVELGVPPCNADSIIEAVLIRASSLLNDEARTRCLAALRIQLLAVDPELEFILGHDDPKTAVSQFLLMVDEDDKADTPTTRNDFQSPRTPGTPIRHPGDATQPMIRPYCIDQWETIQDVIPEPSFHDSCLDMGLFGAHKAVL